MSISWNFDYIKDIELYGNQAYDTDKDFKSVSDAKKHINSMLKHYQCENCGGKRMTGHGVIIEIHKVKMYKQILKKGMFGGEKYVDEHWKTVQRVENMYVKSGGFLGGAGVIECKSCKEKIKGGNAFWGQWAANIAEARRRGEI